MNFPFICSNIPAASAYGVYIYQVIRYSRDCGSYQDFLDRGLLLTRKRKFIMGKFKSSLLSYLVSGDCHAPGKSTINQAHLLMRYSFTYPILYIFVFLWQPKLNLPVICSSKCRMFRYMTYWLYITCSFNNRK
jgi:hypothetical protein